MIWKLLHKLFGWHYIFVRGTLYSPGIRRVKFTPNGKPYVDLPSGITMLDEWWDSYTAYPLTWDGPEINISTPLKLRDFPRRKDTV